MKIHPHPMTVRIDPEDRKRLSERAIRAGFKNRHQFLLRLADWALEAELEEVCRVLGVDPCNHEKAA